MGRILSQIVVVRLMFVGSLFIGTAIQAQEGPVNVIVVECDGSCRDSTLGELCSTQAGRSFRPIAVDCQNIVEPGDISREFQARIRDCPGSSNNRNKCLVEGLSSDDLLGLYCQDINGWDAHVYCEQVTIREGTFPFGQGQPGVNVQTVAIFPREMFPSGTEFTSTPRVQITPKGGNFPDVFAVTARNVTRSSFDVVVFRIDAFGEGWGQNLQIDWRASDEAVQFPLPPASCSQGFGARVGCELPNPSDPTMTIPTTFECFPSASPTFEACQRCREETEKRSCVDQGGTPNPVLGADCRCGVVP